jgi:hypothetical protein
MVFLTWLAFLTRSVFRLHPAKTQNGPEVLTDLDELAAGAGRLTKSISAINGFVKQRFQIATAHFFHGPLEISRVHEPSRIGGGLQPDPAAENFVA